MLMAGAEVIGSYVLGETVGRGSFGVVRRAQHLQTGVDVAIKTINKRRIVSMNLNSKIVREIGNLSQLRHPHIMKLYEVINIGEEIHLITEYLKGGTLYALVTSRTLSLPHVRKLFQQIVSAVLYCHRKLIVHRDLKLENILMSDEANCKVADFGLSNFISDGEFLETFCGSLNYTAPEIITKTKYSGPSVDVWSLGVMLYTMITQKLPFNSKTPKVLCQQIKSGVFEVPQVLKDNPGVLDLIYRMLEVNPQKRIDLCELQDHPWFSVDIPQYLLPPFGNMDVMNENDKINLELVKKVAKIMSIDEKVLIGSLERGVVTHGTVAYKLMNDNLGIQLGIERPAICNHDFDGLSFSTFISRTTVFDNDNDSDDKDWYYASLSSAHHNHENQSHNNNTNTNNNNNNNTNVNDNSSMNIMKRSASNSNIDSPGSMTPKSGLPIEKAEGMKDLLNVFPVTETTDTSISDVHEIFACKSGPVTTDIPTGRQFAINSVSTSCNHTDVPTDPSSSYPLNNIVVDESMILPTDICKGNDIGLRIDLETKYMPSKLLSMTIEIFLELGFEYKLGVTKLSVGQSKESKSRSHHSDGMKFSFIAKYQPGIMKENTANVVSSDTHKKVRHKFRRMNRMRSITMGVRIYQMKETTRELSLVSQDPSSPPPTTTTTTTTTNTSPLQEQTQQENIDNKEQTYVLDIRLFEGDPTSFLGIVSSLESTLHKRLVL